jgi:serine/threonine-protein kinase
VLEVAASLPGANPVAEALAAGETPSPEAVAASGGVGVISIRRGLICLVAIAAGLAANVWMSRHTTLNAFVPVTGGVETMTERARWALVAMGYMSPATNLACQYELDLSVLRRIRDTDRSPTRWEALRSDRLSAVGFRCRAGIPSNGALGLGGRPPADARSGTVSVLLDPAGRLVELTAAPFQLAGAMSPTADWQPLLMSAGLDEHRFTEGPPRHVPPVFAAQWLARNGTLNDGQSAHVEAAWYGGRPVFFALEVPPTDEAAPSDESAQPARALSNQTALSLVSLTVMIAAVLLAPRLLPRADRRGAFRGAVVLGLSTLAVVVLIGGDPAAAVISGLGFWLLYVVLEPSARRWWPEMLVGWSRLLAGRVRDPLVGRDILVGLVAGMMMAGAHHLWFLAPTALGLPPPVPVGQPDTEAWLTWPFMGGGHMVAILPASIAHALTAAPFVSFTLALLASVLSDRRRAGIAWVVLWAAVKTVQLATLQTESVWSFVSDAAFGAITFSIGLVVLTRFGLLAMIVHLIPFVLLTFTVLEFDGATPASSSAYLIVGSLMALTLYALYTALGRPSLFRSHVAHHARVA